jgi:hypothetical protein
MAIESTFGVEAEKQQGLADLYSAQNGIEPACPTCEFYYNDPDVKLEGGPAHRGAMAGEWVRRR